MCYLSPYKKKARQKKKEKKLDNIPRGNVYFIRLAKVTEPTTFIKYIKNIFIKCTENKNIEKEIWYPRYRSTHKNRSKRWREWISLYGFSTIYFTLHRSDFVI